MPHDVKTSINTRGNKMKKCTLRFLALFLTAFLFIAIIPGVFAAAEWRLDENTPRYLPYIDKIESGSENTVYTLVHGEGIWKYDGSRLIEISADLPDVTITMLYSKYGVLYSVGYRGVWCYYNENWVLELEYDSDWPETIYRLVQSKDGTIYAHSFSAIWIFNGEEWSLIDYPTDFRHSIDSLTAGTNGTFYVETSYSGIWMYSNAVWTDISKGFLSGDKTTDTNCILAASDGSLYAATQGRGVWRHDGKVWSDISVELTEDSVYAYTLFESKEGKIYAGTYDGVWQYNGKQWSKFGDNLTGEASVIISLGESCNGTLFAGSRDGVSIYDSDTWKKADGELRGHKKNINSLQLGQSGTLYCSGDGGVWKREGNGWENIGGYEWENPPYVFFEGSDGTLYAGFWFGGGIWKYDGKTWSDMSNGLTGGALYVTAISEDSSGTLYASTDHCVWRYDGSKWNQFYQIPHIPILDMFGQDVNSVIIRDMIIASDNSIYIARATGGVQKFDGTDWTNVNENLPDDLHIDAILEASDGTLYIGAGGLTVWKYDNKEWINISDGIDRNWNYSSIDSLVATNDGNLYMSEGSTIWSYDGSKWYDISTYFNPLYSEVAFSPEGILYAGAPEGIWTWRADKVAAAKNPFIDIPEGDWLYNGVEYVLNNNLFTGTSATTFNPTAEFSRAMVATVLWRNEGCPKPTDTGMFSDLTQDWYKDAVNWAAQVGIVNGYGDGTFRPNQAVTREQLATILYRYIGSPSVNSDFSSSLDDAENISDWAASAVEWTFRLDYLKRRSADYIIEPQSPITRLEAAEMFMRMRYYMT